MPAGRRKVFFSARRRRRTKLRRRGLGGDGRWQVSGPGYMSRKIRKFRTDKFDTWKTEISTYATRVNGWEPAVYMSCMSQNVRLFHVSNLSVRNIRIFLLMYPGSLSAGLLEPWRTTLRGGPDSSRAARWDGPAQQQTEQSIQTSGSERIWAVAVIGWAAAVSPGTWTDGGGPRHIPTDADYIGLQNGSIGRGQNGRHAGSIGRVQNGCHAGSIGLGQNGCHAESIRLIVNNVRLRRE